ncbi:hypothetical protein [Parafrankia elaeagni]|uniref:hypothetical protein n=1 Tax=Parafrankia elaeagni TaxID=222534 RepID=UPI00035FE5BA|nr:hypothetical protein [Parafrankia elaeagni]
MGSSTERLLDVPDADAAEQSRDLRPPSAGEGGGQATDTSPGTSGGAAEADEFDAVEQRLVVEQDDEEEYR